MRGCCTKPHLSGFKTHQFSLFADEEEAAYIRAAMAQQVQDGGGNEYFHNRKFC